MKKWIIFLMMLIAGNASAQWQHLCDLYTARYGASTVVSGDSVLVMGGFTIREHNRAVSLNTIEVLHPMRDHNYGVPLPDSLAFAGAGIMGDRIYLFGGYTSTSTLSDKVYVFDPDSGRWLLHDLLPFPIAAFSLVKLDSSFYLLGGWKDEPGSYNPLVLRYTPSTGQWDTLDVSGWLPRVSSGVGVIGDTAYIFGGFYVGQLDWVTGFDGRTIYQADNLPYPLSGMAVASSVSGTFYLIGGMENASSTNHCWKYTVSTGEWEELPPLPSARAYASATFIDYMGSNYVLVIGGKHMRHAVRDVNFLEVSSIEEEHTPPFTDFEIHYPNPLKNMDFIEIRTPESGVMRVYSSDGRLVMSMPLQSGYNRIKWDAGNLPSGVYIYRFKNRTGKWLYLR